jgi:hypothetical protein
MPNVDFAALVRLIRQARGETQEKFARDLDVSVGTMSSRDNGKRRPVSAASPADFFSPREWEFAILKLIAIAGRRKARKVIETEAGPSKLLSPLTMAAAPCNAPRSGGVRFTRSDRRRMR